jgi:hypothetical protein
MKRCEANRRDELTFRHASLWDEGANENNETRQLLVLCIGTTGLIVADALVWMYFWMI